MIIVPLSDVTRLSWLSCTSTVNVVVEPAEKSSPAVVMATCVAVVVSIVTVASALLDVWPFAVTV